MADKRLFGGTGEFPDDTTGYTTQRRNADGLPLGAELAVDFTPVVGDIKAGIETADYLNKGEYLNAALSGVGILPFIPSLMGVMRGPTKDLFHGTSNRFDKLSESFYYSPMNIYGQGFYTTDSMDIAKGYTRKGGGGEPTLYSIEQPKELNLFDMETPLSEETKNLLRASLTGSAGDYDYLLDESKNLREVYDNLVDDGTADFLNADEIQEYFEDIRATLEQKGYRGFEHTGGLKTGKDPHKVRIYWHPSEDIKFKEIQPEVVSSSRAEIIDRK